MPPSDALATAEAEAPNSADEEIAVSPGVPSLSEINAFVQPGIDPAAEARVLASQDQVAATNVAVKWRGRLSADGVDLANVNGVLCSSPGRPTSKTFRIQVACSDGRMATISINQNDNLAKITFGTTVELAHLEQ